MQQANSLIRTKLRQPFTRPGLVSRPRLQKQIAQGLYGPLTLLIAPAGFGKTTLVATCVAGYRTPVAWLSLDKTDNQKWLFLNYLIAALQEVDPTIGHEAAQLLQAKQQSTPEAVLTNLINEIDIAGKEMILVMDDYQFISSQDVHDEVAFLIEHCPKTFHLVIAARSDPQLPLARLRARGLTVELRASDLRFTEPEAVRFLNDVMGLHLDAGSVAALAERTEGWIAGLQMAALSMRNREDIRGFIEGFSGTNRYIMDYLLEEVLASQPPEIQHFLLCTSILERMTAPLCDAVLANKARSKGEEDDRPHRSESLSPQRAASNLEYLERANLFLVPLDDERIWYRYHHLFADLLRARLQQTYEIPEIAVCHTRAAQWLEQNGFILEAIHHASLTSDTDRIERLIEQNYLEVFRRGDLSAIRFLTGRLSKELVLRNPWLCIYEAESRAWFGELDTAVHFLEQAEKHTLSGAASTDAQAMLGHLSYVKSRVTAMRGDIPQAIALAFTARENTPAGNLALHGGINVLIGYAYFLNGDFSDAIHALEETIKTGVAGGVVSTTIAAHCVLARLYAVQGLYHKAFGEYEEARKYTLGMGRGHRGGLGIVEVGLADLQYEWNDLGNALTHMQQGMENLLYWSKADDLALAYATLARIQQALGNPVSALDAVDKGTQVIRASGVFCEARNAVLATEIRLNLAQGNGPAASRWTSSVEKGLSLGDSFRFMNELTHLTLARVYLAQNNLDRCLGLLSRLAENARTGGRTGRLIEILILTALVMQNTGESVRALEILAEALALAEPEGYVRVFVDEGRPMQQLLVKWLAEPSAGRLRDYAARLLSHFAAEPRETATAQETTSPAGSPIEPLSQRELEVLRLMALGNTNQEIAQQLIISPGTVKAHTSNIYRKLDVANRTEAVTRGRQLGLLP